MYKFLIVDDEEIVRRGFRNKIEWAKAGFEYLPPCKNGREAISRIAQDHPDVVMTDICMPLVDGLEVAAYIADKFPEIVVIILSGYDEFEYARTALRNNVVEYLLKPITSGELTELVTKLKMRLDETARRREVLKNTPTKDTSVETEANKGFPNTKGSRSLAMVKMAEVQEYIEQNFAQKKLSIDEITRDLFISPSYLTRLLKHQSGKTFVDTLTEFRIDKAKEYLSNPGLKTYAIAEMVGYSDPHYFSTIFKKVTGMTPSEYRIKVLQSE